MRKYKGYRIETTRLQNYDYGSNGLYFITICCKDRMCYFGEISNKIIENKIHVERRLSTLGKIAQSYWVNIPAHFPFVEIDEYVIMPNHIQGVLFFNRPEYKKWMKNEFSPQSKNLASVVRGFKAGVKKYATINNINFAWQPRYYDHIIRREKDLHIIRNYIINNPNNWEIEKNNEASIRM